MRKGKPMSATGNTSPVHFAAPQCKARSSRALTGWCAIALGACAWMCMSGVTMAATMYSTKESFMGAGTFYGPGRIKDTTIFDVIINPIGFTSTLNFVTPFVNNGGTEPNVCAEAELGHTKPTGLLSDGVTAINESVDVCSFDLNNAKVLVAIIEGGPHQGQQIAATINEDGEPIMVMTMD